MTVGVAMVEVEASTVVVVVATVVVAVVMLATALLLHRLATAGATPWLERGMVVVAARGMVEVAAKGMAVAVAALAAAKAALFVPDFCFFPGLNRGILVIRGTHNFRRRTLIDTS